MDVIIDPLELPQKKQPQFQVLLLTIVLLMFFVSLTIFIYVSLGFQTNPKRELRLAPSPQPVAPAPTYISPIMTYATYYSDSAYKYKVDYPSSWKIERGENFVRFRDYVSSDSIQLSCSQAPTSKQLPNPKEWEPNEGGYTSKYLVNKTINDMQAVQFVWGTSNTVNDTLYTYMLINTQPILCEIHELVQFSGKDYINEIEKRGIYNKALNSFEFVE